MEESDLITAQRLDAVDDLSGFRDEFLITDPDLIYLDGNSLGRQPRSTANRMRTVIEEEWGSSLIRGWNAGWYEATRRIGGKIASIIGAEPSDVVVADSTSVNLYKLVMAALMLNPDRPRIISDSLNFPSDLYILQGCTDLLKDDHDLVILPSSDGIIIEPAVIIDAIDERTALVVLSHVAYKSGYLINVEPIIIAAHQAGALVLLDLSHSVGVVPIQLEAWGVDMAVGCTYKYLNGGPGSPAFLYIHRNIQERVRSPIWGWFGHQSPFQFDLDYDPAEGIRRFLVGTPPIISLLALEPALDIIVKASIDRIRIKSVLLTTFMIELFDSILEPLGFELGTPRESERRGSHVSIKHPEGYRINRALIEEMNVLPDFREPDNIRLGLSPLYTSFTDVWNAMERIRKVVEEERYLKYSVIRDPVT